MSLNGWHRKSFLLLISGCFLLLYSLSNLTVKNCSNEQLSLDGLRFLYAFKPSTELNVKNVKEVAVLTDNLRYTLEILRVTKRNSNIPNIHSLVQHQLDVLINLLGIQEWRHEISTNLSSRIKATIESLQNPDDCESSRKLYCDLRNPWGLASGVHDLLWCAFNAYLSRSMLVVMSKHWHYTEGGWENVFQPLSIKCKQEVKVEKQTPWPGRCDDDHRHNLVRLPADLEEDLLLLGSNPLPWLYGQLLGNIMKLSDKLNSTLEENLRNVGFKSPVVGIHIRRTDKMEYEGAYHHVDEYMSQVGNYFQSLELGGEVMQEKRVFVATDDPSALTDLQARYPGYRFLFNKKNAEKVEKLHTRYQKDIMESTILEVFMLSMVDYLVCSFSSGFSRLAYELMLFRKPDALDNVYSVDTEYFYAGAANPPRVTLHRHTAISKDELNLKLGDILVLPYFNSLQDDAKKGKVYDGFSEAVNTRTGQRGLYPLYKTVPIYNIVRTAND